MITAPLTPMLKSLLTSSESQPSSVINEVHIKVAGKISNGSGRSIRNFQSLKSIGCTEKLSFLCLSYLTLNFGFRFSQIEFRSLIFYKDDFKQVSIKNL